MELTEPIETLNQRLIDYYGKFENGDPNYRVIFSNDQRELIDGTWEKRTPEGVFLGIEQGVHEVPKYFYARDRYILEKLFAAPPNSVNKLTYEAIWTFEDKHGNYLPPDWLAIKMIIDTVHENIASANGTVKYRDPQLDETPESRAEKFNELAKTLYGNETSVGDALSTDSAVGYGTRKRNTSKRIM